MTKSKTDRYTNLAFVVVILAIIAVIVGVIWTASTGRSGQRVYLGSALISMSVLVCLVYLTVYAHTDKEHTDKEAYTLFDYLTYITAELVIFLGIGFFITAMITLTTGNSTDSLPYLISAVISIAYLILWNAYSYATTDEL